MDRNREGGRAMRREIAWGVIATILFLALVSFAGVLKQANTSAQQVATPSIVGVDESKLAELDADLASGKYGLVDSFLVLRHGQTVYDKTYAHDYAVIYGARATKTGPMNHDPSGEYNYFSANFHPYYKHSDLHTMQSISKTVTSITIGVAMTRNDFPVALDTPILKFLDGYTIAPDERKKRITLRHLLTMTSGIEWHEDLAYDDPRNSSDVMEGKRNWVQYVLDQPMASEPGASFVYSGGDTELLAYLFRKVTGLDIDVYADEHLFKSIGIQHYHWKHSPMGLPDTQGGLFLSTHDLAKIGMLILRDGVWNGSRILSPDWIRDSVSPHVSVGEGGRKYGYQWWLTPYGKSRDRLLWAAHGFGGQQLVIVPEYDALVVFTGWDILPSTEKHRHDALERALSALSADSALNSPPKR